MFDAHSAFSKLNGRSYSDLHDLFRDIGQLRWDHITELPIDFSVRDLLELAMERDWIHDDPKSGKLYVRVPPTPDQGTQGSTARKVARPRRARASAAG